MFNMWTECDSVPVTFITNHDITVAAMFSNPTVKDPLQILKHCLFRSVRVNLQNILSFMFDMFYNPVDTNAFMNLNRIVTYVIQINNNNSKIMQLTIFDEVDHFSMMCSMDGLVFFR